MTRLADVELEDLLPWEVVVLPWAVVADARASPATAFNAAMIWAPAEWRAVLAQAHRMWVTGRLATVARLVDVFDGGGAFTLESREIKGGRTMGGGAFLGGGGVVGAEKVLDYYADNSRYFGNNALTELLPELLRAGVPQPVWAAPLLEDDPAWAAGVASYYGDWKVAQALLERARPVGTELGPYSAVAGLMFVMSALAGRLDQLWGSFPPPDMVEERCRVIDLCPGSRGRLIYSWEQHWRLKAWAARRFAPLMATLPPATQARARRWVAEWGSRLPLDLIGRF